MHTYSIKAKKKIAQVEKYIKIKWTITIHLGLLHVAISTSWTHTRPRLMLNHGFWSKNTITNKLINETLTLTPMIKYDILDQGLINLNFDD